MYLSITSISSGLARNIALAKNERTASSRSHAATADVVWTWQRAFEMKSVRYFFAQVMFLAKPGDIEVIDKYTFRFHL